MYTCEREFSHNMWSLTAHMWSLTAHIAWLWLWLWLRRLDPFEFLQFDDCANRLAGQFAATFRVTRARQRFSPVNSHPILSPIPRRNQS